MKNFRKIGFYEPLKFNKKELNNLKERKSIWWDVYLGGGIGYFARTQFEAEVIGRLERIERMLKKLVSKN